MDHSKVLYLSQADVKATGVTMEEIITIVEEAFLQMSKEKVEMPPKLPLNIGPKGSNNFIHAMPCYIPGLNSSGLKWVSGFPGNPPKGLPYITGLLILNDVETGIAKAIMDCFWITALRTGAASAVSSKYLARPESESIGICGCGVQGHTNLWAFSTLYTLKKAVCFDPIPAQAEKLAQYAESLGVSASVAGSYKEAVEGQDIIVTAGPLLKIPHASIKADWMKEGAFASLVDYDSSWSPEALAQMDIFTTDNRAQYMYNLDVVGYFKNCPPLHGDLSDLVSGKIKGRTSPSQRTVACNLGVALEDLAVAPLIYERAKTKNIGQWLAL